MAQRNHMRVSDYNHMRAAQRAVRVGNLESSGAKLTDINKWLYGILADKPEGMMNKSVYDRGWTKKFAAIDVEQALRDLRDANLIICTNKRWYIRK